ncbi:hypothetical protein PO124_10625 [Bacillus licheniformis]|nr:hypothetical protein [Bacillus licheniformis]
MMLLAQGRRFVQKMKGKPVSDERRIMIFRVQMKRSLFFIVRILNEIGFFVSLRVWAPLYDTATGVFAEPVKSMPGTASSLQTSFSTQADASDECAA